MRAILALLLVAIATASAAASSCDRCGSVVSVKTTTSTNSWTPLGSMPSASERLAPGQVSTQYDFGNRNVVLVGSAGGAGYAKRSNSYAQTRWVVNVRMDDGSDRSITSEYEPVVREGDRVRVYGRQLELEP